MLKLKEYYYDTDIYGGIIDNKITMEFEIKNDGKRVSERKFKQIDEPLLKQTRDDEYATDVISETQMREMHEFIGKAKPPKVKKVITDNPPYTTILFEDGTKQVVKARTKISYEDKGILPSPATTFLRKETEYDREKGIMIAILERIYGKKELYRILGWEKEKST